MVEPPSYGDSHQLSGSSTNLVYTLHTVFDQLELSNWSNLLSYSVGCPILFTIKKPPVKCFITSSANGCVGDEKPTNEELLGMKTVSINYECRELAKLTSLRDSILEMSELASLPYIQKICSSSVAEHCVNKQNMNVFFKVVVDKIETLGLCDITEKSPPPPPPAPSKKKDKLSLKKKNGGVLSKKHSNNPASEKEPQREAESTLTVGYRSAGAHWVWNWELGTHFFCKEGPLYFTQSIGDDEVSHKRFLPYLDQCVALKFRARSVQKIEEVRKNLIDMNVLEENSAMKMEKNIFFLERLGKRSEYRYSIPCVDINAMHVNYNRQCVSYFYCNGSECSHLRLSPYEV